MCGIFGLSDCKKSRTQEEMTNALLGGLEKMEYRGYDSAGLSVVSGDHVLMHSRSVGRVSNLEKKVRSSNKGQESNVDKFVGIAHIRWATHGKATEENAHPVRSDENGTFFVVHNGIISNYSELKAMLVEKGHNFETQTDTEVASKLALQFYNEDNNLTFPQIARKVMETCTGAFAFIFISTKFPDQMVAVRQNAPVILGIKNPTAQELEKNTSAKAFTMDVTEDSSFVISSDISAIIDHTLDLVYLEDGDVVLVSKDKGVSIFPENMQEDPLGERKVTTTTTSLDSVNKGAFTHFMLKEIHEQGESILNAMRNRVDFENSKIMLESLESHKEKLSSAGRYIFIACGTSYHSSHATKKIFEELTGAPVVVEIASHFLDLEPKIFPSDVIFFVSQSGETFDTLAALKYCKKAGALTVGITNSAKSTMAKTTSCSMDVHAGIEKGVASTKAYTSQFISIVLVALFISQHKNIAEKRRAEIIKGMAELPGQIEECLKMDVQHFIDELGLKDSMIVIGRGYQASTCLEGSLKIKEISYIHSEGILAGELKHGPLALVSDDKNVVIIIANDDFFQKSHSALEQLQARGAIPFVVCTDDIKHRYAKSVGVPRTVNCLQGLLTVIPFQLISYGLALKKGYDPDFPRNLAKSVTVE